MTDADFLRWVADLYAGWNDQDAEGIAATLCMIADRHEKAIGVLQKLIDDFGDLPDSDTVDCEAWAGTGGVATLGEIREVLK